MNWDFDASSVVSVTLLALLWMPLVRVVRFPAWFAAIIAFGMMGGFGAQMEITLDGEGGYRTVVEYGFARFLPGALVAAFVCEVASRLLFVHSIRPQLLFTLFAAALFVTAFGVYPALALPTGLALGSFQIRRLQRSISLFAVLGLIVSFFVAAIHPGMWGPILYRTVVSEYLPAIISILLFGLGLQLGAAMHRLCRENEARRMLEVARREFGDFIDRLGETSAVGSVARA